MVRRGSSSHSTQKPFQNAGGLRDTSPSVGSRLLPSSPLLCWYRRDAGDAHQIPRQPLDFLPRQCYLAPRPDEALARLLLDLSQLAFGQAQHAVGFRQSPAQPVLGMLKLIDLLLRLPGATLGHGDGLA